MRELSLHKLKASLFQSRHFVTMACVLAVADASRFLNHTFIEALYENSQ
jgi:hypothetical protein